MADQRQQSVAGSIPAVIVPVDNVGEHIPGQLVGLVAVEPRLLDHVLAAGMNDDLPYAMDRGVVRDGADVALRLGLSRARISQLLDLTLLAPDIQGGSSLPSRWMRSSR